MRPTLQNGIYLRGIDLPCQIGVPLEERSRHQLIKADVGFALKVPFEQMQDNLSQTLDYALVTENLKNLALNKPRLLLETLISEMTDVLFQYSLITHVEITLYKKILPGVDHVSISMSRSREEWSR